MFLSRALVQLFGILLVLQQCVALSTHGTVNRLVPVTGHSRSRHEEIVSRLDALEPKEGWAPFLEQKGHGPVTQHWEEWTAHGHEHADADATSPNPMHDHAMVQMRAEAASDKHFHAVDGFSGCFDLTYEWTVLQISMGAEVSINPQNAPGKPGFKKVPFTMTGGIIVSLGCDLASVELEFKGSMTTNFVVPEKDWPLLRHDQVIKSVEWVARMLMARYHFTAKNKANIEDLKRTFRNTMANAAIPDPTIDANVKAQLAGYMQFQLIKATVHGLPLKSWEDYGLLLCHKGVCVEDLSPQSGWVESTKPTWYNPFGKYIPGSYLGELILPEAGIEDDTPSELQVVRKGWLLGDDETVGKLTLDHHKMRRYAAAHPSSNKYVVSQDVLGGPDGRKIQLTYKIVTHKPNADGSLTRDPISSDRQATYFALIRQARRYISNLYTRGESLDRRLRKLDPEDRPQNRAEWEELWMEEATAAWEFLFEHRHSEKTAGEVMLQLNSSRSSISSSAAARAGAMTEAEMYRYDCCGWDWMYSKAEQVASATVSTVTKANEYVAKKVYSQYKAIVESPAGRVVTQAVNEQVKYAKKVVKTAIVVHNAVVDEIVETTGDFIDDVVETAGDIADHVVETTDKIVDHVVETTGEIVDVVVETTEEIMEATDEVIDHIIDTTLEIAEETQELLMDVKETAEDVAWELRPVKCLKPVFLACSGREQVQKGNDCKQRYFGTMTLLAKYAMCELARDQVYLEEEQRSFWNMKQRKRWTIMHMFPELFTDVKTGKDGDWLAAKLRQLKPIAGDHRGFQEEDEFFQVGNGMTYAELFQDLVFEDLTKLKEAIKKGGEEPIPQVLSVSRSGSLGFNVRLLQKQGTFCGVGASIEVAFGTSQTGKFHGTGEIDWDDLSERDSATTSFRSKITPVILSGSYEVLSYANEVGPSAIASTKLSLGVSTVVDEKVYKQIKLALFAMDVATKTTNHNPFKGLFDAICYFPPEKASKAHSSHSGRFDTMVDNVQGFAEGLTKAVREWKEDPGDALDRTARKGYKKIVELLKSRVTKEFVVDGLQNAVKSKAIDVLMDSFGIKDPRLYVLFMGVDYKPSERECTLSLGSLELIEVSLPLGPVSLGGGIKSGVTYKLTSKNDW